MSILGGGASSDHLSFDASSQVVTIDTSKDNIEELLKIEKQYLSIQIDFMDTYLGAVIQTKQQLFIVKYNYEITTNIKEEVIDE